ncbi:MAG: hypothetical protein REI78_00125 [Pedobacter sp.]|nr:hypothetical protein [Pedobacter sp.]MDQ8051393.1 hypothetical protein [Pedobacter sp.]
MKILITGGRSAKAIKLMKAFSGWEIIMADYGDMPTLASANYQLLSLGDINEESIAHLLLTHCLDQQVDVLLPLHRFEIEPLIKADILFEEFNVSICAPDRNSYLDYLLPAQNPKKDWAIFNQGELVYCTMPNAALDQLGTENRWNGAFEMENLDGEWKLNLMLI